MSYGLGTVVRPGTVVAGLLAIGSCLACGCGKDAVDPAVGCGSGGDGGGGAACEAFYGDLAPGAVTPPCTENRWGTAAEALAIEDAMYMGSASDARDAIEAARRTRGNEVGCGEIAFDRASPNPVPPGVAAVESAWETIYLPVLASYADGSCPPIGRDWPALALAGYYAGGAGLGAPEMTLARIVREAVGTQYLTAHAPEPLVTYQGLYAYSEGLGDVTNPCHRTGIVGNTIARLCAVGESVCPRYDGGPWAGERFAVVDFFTDPRAFDGGAAYDHAWSAAAVLEGSLVAPTAEDAGRWRASLLTAAGWSAEEPAVRNHNYTAKNVWVLALAYGLTGEGTLRDAMMDKVRRSLVPGVLVDLDCNGEVDDLDGVRFADLVPYARLPGRMWDAHNALPWYHAMNAWALAEVYVALRERGDTELAREVRPYAVAMIDNLARELLELGPPLVGSAQQEPIPFALAVGLWKIADREADTPDAWGRAFATLWNAGYFAGPGFRRAAALTMYLLHRRGIPFVAYGSSRR